MYPEYCGAPAPGRHDDAASQRSRRWLPRGHARLAAPPLRAQADLEVLPGAGQGIRDRRTAAATPTVQVGPDGPLVVDPQPAALSATGAGGGPERLRPADSSHRAHERRRSERRRRGEPRQGRPLSCASSTRSIPRGIDTRASIIAHLNVLNRMTEARGRRTSWPTDTYFTAEWSLFSNGEAVQLVHVPGRAHRRRHDRLLPPLGCHQRRRHLRHDGLSAVRPANRRQHRRHHRRIEPHPGHRHSRREPGGRHSRRSGPRPAEPTKPTSPITATWSRSCVTGSATW